MVARRTLAIVAVAAAAVLLGVLFAVTILSPPAPGPQAGGVFTFAAAGDFGGPTDGKMLALADRLAADNVSFLLGLGDLGYTSDEEAWCSAIKGRFANVLVVAGNHDTTESGPGDIAQDVLHCPFPLEVPLVPGPGPSGYGYEYYFDYPADTPLVRVILIVPGIRGQISWDYGEGSSHYTWVVDAVNDARTRGIPWVVAGMHKQCITVGAKTDCTMGQAMFDKLVDLKVDLVLQGHDHVYGRSRQLALGSACATVPAGGAFDTDCIVAEGAFGRYTQGAGSVVVIAGTGGASLYAVDIDGSDAELGYFVHVMGGNANTLGRTPGFGSVRIGVSEATLEVATDFCPQGTTGALGKCAGARVSSFQDAFTIQRPSSQPPSHLDVPPSSFLVARTA